MSVQTKSLPPEKLTLRKQKEDFLISLVEILPELISSTKKKMIKERKRELYLENGQENKQYDAHLELITEKEKSRLDFVHFVYRVENIDRDLGHLHDYLYTYPEEGYVTGALVGDLLPSSFIRGVQMHSLLINYLDTN